MKNRNIKDLSTAYSSERFCDAVKKKEGDESKIVTDPS